MSSNGRSYTSDHKTFRRPPASAAPLHDLILGLLVHMVVMGLTISYCIRRFAK
jgi:hypothetical protein